MKQTGPEEPTAQSEKQVKTPPTGTETTHTGMQVPAAGKWVREQM